MDEGAPHGGGRELAGFQRRYLRGLANPLRPVVHVGAAGVTENVLAATDRALADHELVKVRLHDPEDKHAMADALAAGAHAQLAGVIGHTVILYRRHPEHPRIRLPERERGSR
ncbi:MAG TPA: ribosome assembly RNA-binding protein YhbY [Myxococcota bacterium]|nr:ribosome assembly RNA-binding protein YhbY [Myxococcota bacterium]